MCNLNTRQRAWACPTVYRAAMGGACPSRAPPVGGWYDNCGKWVHVEVKVVISDGKDGGLRGEGEMSATNVMTVRFDHRRDRQLRGEIQPNGNISWGNDKTWKYAASGALRLRPRRGVPKGE